MAMAPKREEHDPRRDGNALGQFVPYPVLVACGKRINRPEQSCSYQSRRCSGHTNGMLQSDGDVNDNKNSDKGDNQEVVSTDTFALWTSW
jgi:hypothetical protein